MNKRVIHATSLHRRVLGTTILKAVGLGYKNIHQTFIKNYLLFYE